LIAIINVVENEEIINENDRNSEERRKWYSLI